MKGGRLNLHCHAVLYNVSGTGGFGGTEQPSQNTDVGLSVAHLTVYVMQVFPWPLCGGFEMVSVRFRLDVEK